MEDKVKIQVQISKEVWNQFKELSNEIGIRHGVFLEYLLKNYIDKGDVGYEYKKRTHGNGTKDIL